MSHGLETKVALPGEMGKLATAWLGETYSVDDLRIAESWFFSLASKLLAYVARYATHRAQI